jgi:hypothetical protein
MKSLFALTLALVCLALETLDAATLRLADQGRSLQPIVISSTATDATKALAAELATQLSRISGAKFEIQSGDGGTGITLGRAEDFPALKTGIDFSSTEITKQEEYLLRSHEKGLWVIGSTDLAVRDAVWDLLYRAGYRQFFPGKNWEVVPSQPQLAIEVDSHEQPAYYARRIWFGFGAWDYAKGPYREWCEKNRAVSGIALSTGHSYGGILSRNKAAFAAHPEYLALVNGERKSSKFQSRLACARRR